MSRPAHAHLPPRCPLQSRASRHVQDPPVSPTFSRNDGLRPLHYRSSSQSSILEEQPSWLDELLSDSETHSKGTFLRRSASDSAALVEGLASFSGISSVNDGQSAISDETGNSLVDDCVYGPNSPRRKSNLTHSRDPIVSALSEYVSRKPLQFLSGDICVSETIQSYSKGNACGSNGELDSEANVAQRHPAQRSRVRKLQYIAELERTVNVFQTLESELEARVASLLQKRVLLSVENNTLKQQIVYLQKEKLFKAGQYQTLKKEVERLTKDYTNHLKSSPHSRTGSNIGVISSEASWKILDMGRLSLGGNPVTLNCMFSEANEA
ncbi:basic leucine zipper 6 isoform X2 [Telopea speciosissima]|uniref:basic leucine zipper 6 isoform X1 n=1 Tax=Telopea speciosissima TaxID=54955 RepID=UPI001CC583AF|nr:basic leucine zipper 6 isoform X1 [Telopea speciosissima]XP_043691503.1 basic leucine zipper 6 isoform X2 [Telopea speciosissima]